MSHSPFEDWMLSDDPLTPQDAAALREHTAGCKQCAALQLGWSDARRQLTAAPMAAPQPGFEGRWRRRLSRDRQRRARRQSAGVMGSLGLGMVVSLAALAWSGMPQLPLLNLADVVASSVRWMANLTAAYYVTRHLLEMLANSLPPAVVLGWGSAAAVAAAALCGAWLLLIYQLKWNFAQKGAQR